MPVSWTSVWQGSNNVNVGSGYYTWDASSMKYKAAFHIGQDDDPADYDTDGSNSPPV